MKKISKSDLRGLTERVPVMGVQQQKEIFGGGFVGYYQMQDGTVTNWDYNGNKYAVFTATDGRTLVLDGVNVGSNTLPFQQSNTACYYNGQIRIGEDWTTFCFNDLIHEYGHYLQSQTMSTSSYYYGAIMSMWNIWWNNGYGHSDLPFEQDATNRGEDYADQYYGYPTDLDSN